MEKRCDSSWVQAIHFVSEVYTLTKDFPGGEPETLSYRIRKTAISLSIALNSINTEEDSFDNLKKIYLVLSLSSILETYIIIAGEHYFSKEIKLLLLKLEGLKDFIKVIYLPQIKQVSAI